MRRAGRKGRTKGADPKVRLCILREKVLIGAGEKGSRPGFRQILF